MQLACFDLRVADRGAGQHPALEGARVDERLEGRADLPLREDRAVVFALREIASADQRANGPGVIVDDDERALQVFGGRLRVRAVLVVLGTARMLPAGLRLDFRQR